MSFSWDDLTSKSDIFYQTLPTYNKNGTLKDNSSFKFTSRPKNGKYSLKANHTNGKRGKVEFNASETYTGYYNTKLGYSFSTSPGIDLSAKITDDLIPLKGSSLNLNVTAQKKVESVSATFKYQNDTFTDQVSVSIPLSKRVFNLEGEEEDTHKTVNIESVYKLNESKGIYLGLNTEFELPNNEESLKYDVKSVVATKNSAFDGGVYYRKSSIKDSNKVGTWATTVSKNTTLSTHFSFEFTKNEYQLESFASFDGSNNDTYLFGFQVFPRSTASFGYRKSLSENTKFSFGYAFAVNKAEEGVKTNAFKFGLELSH